MWFGGYPLFLFYGPLFFIIVAGVSLVVRTVPLALVFRVALLATLMFASVGIWYATRVFFGSRAGKVAIFASFLFIFYPMQYAPLGIGAGGVFFMGLFDGTLGLAFLLFWIAFLERMRTASHVRMSRRYFFAALTCLVGVVLSHTLMSFAALFVGLTYVIVYIRDHKLLMRSFLMVVLSVLITAPFIIPFLRFLNITSSSPLGDLNRGDALLYVFPFDIRDLLSTGTISSFAWWALLFFIFCCTGAYIAFKKEKKFVPVVIIASFIFLVHQYFYSIFPSLGVHYYRFTLLVYVLCVMVASYGISELIASKKFLIRTLSLVGGIGVVAYLFFTFNMSVNAGDSGFELLGKVNIPYGWNLASYIGSADDQKILDVFKQLPVQRAAVDMETSNFYIMQGSPHYFETMLPLQNNQAIITGLYSESSPLTPFIYSVMESIAQHPVNGGDARISQFMPNFFFQPAAAQVSRLTQMGVNYFLSWNEETTRNLASASSTHDIFSLGEYHIFKLDGVRPLVYNAPYAPGVFVNNDGNIPFKNLSFALYASTSTYAVPVVDGMTNIAGLAKLSSDRFGFIMVSETNLTPAQVAALKATGKPVILLANGTPLPQLPARWFEISHFQTFSLPASKYVMVQGTPYSWLELSYIFQKNSSLFLVPHTSVSVSNLFLASDGQHLSFTGQGPVVLNFGYAPYWHVDNCSGDCRVWRVTPDEMLVFADGTVHLSYSPDQLYYILQWISLATIVGLAGWGIWGKVLRGK